MLARGIIPFFGCTYKFVARSTPLLTQRSIHLNNSRCSTASSESTSGQVLQPLEPSPKILSIVEEIGKLTLLEVSELNRALKEKLKIPDAPMMSFAAGAIPASKSAKAETEDEVGSKTVQTAFTLKITKFDDGKKVALIKEIKNLVEGLNLVQAKKFVESVPQVVRNNLSKEEADKLKAQLEAVGATCAIE